MADKILRPITDVEIVERMTENDTVLIEQGGEIKRAKGVAGGVSGGGSAGASQVDVFIVHVRWDLDFEQNTVTLATDKTFEETYAAVNAPFDEEGLATGNAKLVLMDYMGTLAYYSAVEGNDGKYAITFSTAPDAKGVGAGTYVSEITQFRWVDDGAIHTNRIKFPADYCEYMGAETVNVPIPM